MNKKDEVIKLLNKIHDELDFKNFLKELDKDKDFLKRINKV